VLLCVLILCTRVACDRDLCSDDEKDSGVPTAKDVINSTVRVNLVVFVRVYAVLISITHRCARRRSRARRGHSALSRRRRCARV
jgi:hypothetical protein